MPGSSEAADPPTDYRGRTGTLKKEQSMRQPQSVGINLTAKCNATCGHCCVESSPINAAALEDAQVDHIVEDLIAHPDVREIGFTGGEPLLRRARFLELVRRVTEAGLTATCVTNGFWAITPKAASATFREFEKVGLSSLTISFDNFHVPFVSVRRIRNALDAAARSSVPTILNMAVSRSQDSMDLLRQLGESTLGVQVTRFPVQQCGTGRAIPAEDLFRKPLEEVSLHCPGFEIIYHHDQKVYPCCSPTIFETGMTLGKVGETDHEGFARRLERNALLAVIQRHGLGWFVERIRAVNPDSEVARMDKAVSACDVCATVLNDQESLEALRDEIIDAATV